MEDKKTLFIIDGSSVIYRAFHAIPQSFSNTRGLPTNAIYGFTQTLKKILKEYRPDYIGVAFDVKGPSFRHELYTEYKAERPPMPDLLAEQMPYIKRMVEAFGIPALEKESFEADDVMATIVERLKRENLKVVLITGDKDMHQLVDADTVILDYIKDREAGPAEVAEKFGVEAGLIKDLLALAGDASDNIPGVPGIGVKTAAKLIREYGSLDRIYENVDSVRSEKLRENLKKFKDQAYLSKDLATLHTDVPVEVELDKLSYSGPDYDALIPLLKELEFTKVLTEMMPEEAGGDTEPRTWVVDTATELADALSMVRSAGRAAVSVTMSEEGFSGKLLGAAVAAGDNEAFYMPVTDTEGEGFTEEELVEGLRNVLEDDSISKDTDNSKALYLLLERHGVELKGVDMDISLASYLVNPSKPAHTVEALTVEYLNASLEAGASGNAGFECKKVRNIDAIAKILNKQLEDEGLMELYRTMELPLAAILASMERWGIRIDTGKLCALSGEMDIQMQEIEKRIYASAGTEFNINSPKQLSTVLFEKLGLRPIKKTKTGFSTNEEVLTRLAAEHEVPQLIINYRQLSKLKSTYVDALLEIVDAQTHRVHTSFNQTVTATGRLSSSKPNLQNIPIRGESAGRIREAFVAEPGYTFLSADYSQIELRIVAHLSEDPVFVDSFMKDEDIHTRTASEIFAVPTDEVTPDMRRRAKAINFGIIYGMGPYGLSSNLGIQLKEAAEYIDSYFIHYGKVAEFIEQTIDEARERGYTTTIFGRRRFIPELKSPVESYVRLGERLAINTPVQGPAADIIKAAMIEIDRKLKEGGYSTRMILQIHDELVFEVAPGEIAPVTELVKKGMEGVVTLKVPVKVNLKKGENWHMVE